MNIFASVLQGRVNDDLIYAIIFVITHVLFDVALNQVIIESIVVVEI